MLATSPMTATTWSWVTSLVTTLVACSALDWSSSVTTRSFLPSTPPALLIWSTASIRPLWELLPKSAVAPLREANSPTTISAESALRSAGFLHPAASAAATSSGRIS